MDRSILRSLQSSPARAAVLRGWSSRIDISPKKEWIEAGAYKHPAMIGIGPGIEQNTHKIGECIDQRELRSAIAFLARYPGAFAAQG